MDRPRHWGRGLIFAQNFIGMAKTSGDLVRRPSAGHPLPELCALLICETIFRDPTTGKTGIIGVYDRITAPEVPFNTNLCSYIRLVGGHGRMRVSLELVAPTGAIESDVSLDVVFPPEGSAEVQLLGVGVKLGIGTHALRVKIEGHQIGPAYYLHVLDAVITKKRKR